MNYDEFVKNATDALRSQRSKLGLTQEQLAERIGKHQSVIARFESGGVKDPRLSMVFDYCKGIDTEPSEIFMEAVGYGGKKDTGKEKIKMIRSKLKELQKSSRDDTQKISELIKLM